MKREIIGNLAKGRLNKHEQKVAKKVNLGRKKEWMKKRGHSKKDRLYALAVMTGYRRGQRQQHPQTSILKIQGSLTRDDGAYYVGKKCAYVYKVRNAKGVSMKAIWGKVSRLHGNTGCVRAKFSTNLPPTAIGQRVRIMMYPSRI